MNQGVNNKKEIEILEFVVGGNNYGLFIDDIKEILPYKKPTPIPNSNHNIEGIYIPRDFIITVVNLAGCLNIDSTSKTKKEMLVVTSIQDLDIAFHVDYVNGIHRISENNLNSPEGEVSTSVEGAIVNTLMLGETYIEILDTKKVIAIVNSDIF